MKSGAVIGEVNRRIRKEDVRSFDNSIPANNAMNTLPNIASPGAKFFILNIVFLASAGMELLIIERAKVAHGDRGALRV